MKLRPFALALVALLPASAFLACSDNGTGIELPTFDSGTRDSGGNTGKDGGPTSDGGPSTDGGDGGVQEQGTLLKAGDVQVVGVMPDGTAVYLSFGAKISLEAVAITGGAPTVIAADLKLSSPGKPTDDSFQVSQGVVGLWTGTDGATGNAKLQIWTKANGLKDAAALAPAADFVAGSADGTRVGFIRHVGANDELVVSLTTFATAANVVQSPLARGNAANACDPDFGFQGKYLFSATCTGAQTTATIRRSEDTGAPVTIATGQNPLVNASAAGDRVFAWTRPGVGRAYSISAAGTVTSIAVESGIAEGVISDDGTAVFYRTNQGAIHKAATTTAANVVTLVDNAGAMGLLGFSSDFKYLLSHKLAPGGTAQSPRFDIQLSGTAAAAAPTVLVAAATALPIGFTGNGSHALYLPDPATATVLKARPVAGGGAEKDLGKISSFGGSIAGSSKIIIGDNPTEITVGGQKTTVLDYKLLDVAGAGAATPLLTAVDPGLDLALAGKKVLFTQPGKGLFVKDVP